MKIITVLLKTRKLVLLIFLLGLSLRISLVWQQQGLSFVDNIASFIVATGNYGRGLTEDKWLSNQDFFNSHFTNRTKSVNYQLVKENAAYDVHPPLYFYIIHCLITINKGKPDANMLYLLALIFYLISFVILYKLSFLVLKSYPKVLFALLLFSLSFGALSGFIIFRMYMLQTPLILGTIYLFFLQKEKKILSTYDYIVFGILVFLASYTHYYSFIALFILFFILTFHYLFVDRDFDRLKKYFYTLTVASLSYVALFPTVFERLEDSKFGKNARGALFSINWQKLNHNWELLQRQLFYGVLFILLIYILGYLIYKLTINRQNIKKTLFDSIDIVYIFPFTVLLSIFILYISPFNDMRYVYFTTPYIFIWMAYYLPTFKKNVVIVVISLWLAIHSLISVYNGAYTHYVLEKNLMYDVSEKNLYLVREVPWKTVATQYNARGKELYVSKKLKWDVVKSRDNVAIFIEKGIGNYKELENELAEKSYKKLGTYNYFNIFVKRQVVKKL